MGGGVTVIEFGRPQSRGWLVGDILDGPDKHRIFDARDEVSAGGAARRERTERELYGSLEVSGDVKSVVCVHKPLWEGGTKSRCGEGKGPMDTVFGGDLHDQSDGSAEIGDACTLPIGGGVTVGS